MKFNFRFLVFISIVAALGGFLFGYDWVVIGGAKPFYEIFFHITTSTGLKGWAMSSALVGCIFGAIGAGMFSDKFGRKSLLLVAACLFTISAFGTGIAETFNLFIIYRIIGGAGIGIASTISPMYIAEIAPSKTRGFYVSINQLTIVIGILAAQITNLLIKEPIPDSFSNQDILASWNGQFGWRWMFWAELVPAILFFILIFFIPESPRFLVKRNKIEKSRSILHKIGGENYSSQETQNIIKSFKSASKPGLSELLKKNNLSILLIGIFLAVFQQWCGINIIFNYAQEIFEAAGYGINDLFINIVITGSINLIFTILAMEVVDRIGRRKIMLFGSGLLALIYFLIGLFYYNHLLGWPLLLLFVLAIATYAVSLAPVTWVVLSEIFPNRYRGRAMSICTFSLWIASALLVQTFPYLNKTFGTAGSFWLYGLICAFGYVFILEKLPETKNKSLEKIEDILLGKKNLKKGHLRN